MSLVHEVTPPRFFARLRVPWAAPTSAEYFCAERVALWRKNGRSKCSREIWVTELRTRGQGPASALMIHPGSLLSRNPPQLNFTLTDISLLPSPREPTAPSSMKRRNRGIDSTPGNRSFLHRIRGFETFRARLGLVRDDDLPIKNHSFLPRLTNRANVTLLWKG